MKFAHLADCHIGSWRDPKLIEVSTKAFVKAIDMSIEKNVDFILISGDLFNTSLPSIERLKETVEKLRELKDKNIPVYVIAGSHDFSPSGKTMLDVLEKADLFTNVGHYEIEAEKIKLKFTIDKKTGAKITGLYGKKGGLEKNDYENLLKIQLEQEPGYKIFLFHSALDELKPDYMKDIDSQPLNYLPKNFNYYAGGHPHYVFQKNEESHGLITYPGPLFPNNFKEVEDLETGGFYIVNVDEQGNTKAEWEQIQIYSVHKIFIDANNKTPEQIEEEVNSIIKIKEFTNTIVTLRIEGTLLSGKPSDINFKDMFERIYLKSAYFVMKNTSKLVAKEFEEVKTDLGSVEEIETNLIKENIGQINVAGMDTEKEQALINTLMGVLSTEKQEGETVTTFETRIRDEIGKIFNLK